MSLGTSDLILAGDSDILYAEPSNLLSSIFFLPEELLPAISIA
jgi:hypothetical protein